jgi:hypothetical protein
MSEFTPGENILSPEMLAARERFTGLAKQFLPIPETLEDGQSDHASFAVKTDPEQIFQAESLEVGYFDDNDLSGIGRYVSIGFKADRSGLHENSEKPSYRITHAISGDFDGEFALWLGETSSIITSAERVNNLLDSVEILRQAGKIASEPTLHKS